MVPEHNEKRKARKNGSVVLKDTEGREIKRWNFFRAFPCRWIGPALNCRDRSTFAVERIEIAHEGLEVDNDSEPFDFHIGADMSGTKNFVSEMAQAESAQQNNTVVLQHQIPANPNAVHCDIYAWNAALDNGLDPRGQNGEIWDGNRLTVNQIYDLYPSNRHTGSPPPNTAGYIFFYNREDGIESPTHMEFYDNTNESSKSYIRYKTDGIESPLKYFADIDEKGSSIRIFVALKKRENK